MGVKQCRFKVAFLLIIVFCFMCMSIIINDKVMFKERGREYQDIQTLQEISDVFNKQFKDELFGGILNSWVGNREFRTFKLGNEGKLDYTVVKLSIPEVYSEIEQENVLLKKLVSIEGRSRVNNVYIYVFSNNSIRVCLEDISGTVVRCKYIDDEFAR